MKKMIVGGLAAAAVAGGIALATAGQAGATTYGYRGDRDSEALALEMQAENWLQTPSDARTMAVLVCEKRASGDSELDVAVEARRQILARFPSTPIEDARRIAAAGVIDSEWHFCPWQLDNSGPGNNGQSI